MKNKIDESFKGIVENDNGLSAQSDLLCSETSSECGDFIGLQLSTSILGFGFIDESDDYNYIGFASSATDGYDGDYDIVEPPPNPTLE